MAAIACVLVAIPSAGARTLTIDERVAASRAIEQVFWSHRIWPEENPKPKPPLVSVLPDAVIRARIETTLRESTALEIRWHRPVTAALLQAEIDRIVTHTRDPRMLRELFHALGDDPLLIAETIARPILADRMIRAAHGGDAASFSTWWAAEGSSFSAHAGEINASFQVGRPEAVCALDTWAPTFADVPDARADHVAVWTGSEMIVWGGASYDTWYFHSGARYDPATDTWSPMGQGGGPSPRRWASAVWTGSELIVWGGAGPGTTVNLGNPIATGGRYDPTTDAWSATSNGANVPTPRWKHTAVWTGSRMIVWGGADASSPTNTGAVYDPATDSWAPTSVGANVPAARSSHTAVWTGSEMIVWGGQGSSSKLNSGARYTVSSNTWVATATSGAPAARSNHTAVWTGSEMIVWGGTDGSSVLGSGGRYFPATNFWNATPTTGAPSARMAHSAVWTGTDMIVWGGFNSASSTVLATGGRYRPSSNWTATANLGAPQARQHHTAVWTGTEMIVWGGDEYNAYGAKNTGGRYDPAANSWLATSTATSVPLARENHTAVWTGSEMIVWGGLVPVVGYTNTGGRYVPATDSWSPTSTGAGVPSGRYWQTAAWTGTEMVVWGGTGSSDASHTGGRYDPATDTWQATAPETNGMAISLPRSVWTGTEMIVWQYGSGSRYNPASDTWIPVGQGGLNAFLGYAGQSAVWTGSEMIVWGGTDTSFVENFGSAYSPSSDSWHDLPTGPNVPAPRQGHVAFWTGREMIIWAGKPYPQIDYNGGARLGSGGRYDRATDSWIPMSNTPNPPYFATDAAGAWTGIDLLLWGGDWNTGGRYDPAHDTWQPLPVSLDVPDGRVDYPGVWTGTSLIVWGGGPFHASGGVYCACPSPESAFLDADGDGYGDPASPKGSCDGTLPSGSVLNSLDCDDAAAAIHPGATEVCNAIDDNCNGAIDDGIAAPGGMASLTESRSGFDAVLSWTGVAAATAYDVVKGDLIALRGGGDYTLATNACLGNDVASPTATDTEALTPGAASFHLVRAINCGGSGSFDEGVPSQAASRDAGIAASGSACP